MRNEGAKLFIWDFHGTLEQGNEHAVIAFSNIALEAMGFLERFRDADVERLYGRPWFEYFSDLLPHLAHEVHVALQTQSYALNATHWHIIERHIRPTAHSMDVLAQIAQAGHDQILISNTEQDSLLKFVDTVGMWPFFEGRMFGVDTYPSMRGRRNTKTEIAQDYLARGREFGATVVIGDSAGDMKIGTDLGSTRYLYTHPGMRHREAEADFRITDLRHVLREV